MVPSIGPTGNFDHSSGLHAGGTVGEVYMMWEQLVGATEG